MTKARVNADNASADIQGVTAGTGLSGGGTSGTVSIAVDDTVTATLTGVQTLTNKVLLSPEERTTISATAATGTINFDAVTQGVLYYTTAATGNWTMNVRGSSGATLDSVLATGDALTVVFMNTNTGTAYYATGFQIDGSSVTPKWQNGVAPSAGNVNSIDIYTYTIIKTGSAAFTVLASQTKFA